MKTLSKYLYGNEKSGRWGSVYHDAKLKQAVMTDDWTMIISKECYKADRDVQQLRKNKNTSFSFDWHTFNYMKVVIDESELQAIDAVQFYKGIALAERNFKENNNYEDELYVKYYFKDFGFVLSSPVIHTISMFIKDNEKKNLIVFRNKEDPTKALFIKAYDSNSIEWVNLLAFMPVAYGNDYRYVISGNNVRCEEGRLVPDFKDARYSWSDMANELTDRGIPHDVVAKLADPFYAGIIRRPVFSILKFDDYLHEKYGDYESQDKSMQDIFKELFGEDADKIAYFFGVEKKDN